jgi:acetyltransferase-like isoleucine patch superfamily enzyme
MSRAAGRATLGAYRLASRIRDKALNVGWRGAFAEFGSHSVLAAPVRIDGEQWISIGSGVYFGAGGYLQVIERDGEHGRIEIGDGSSMTGGCTLSAAASVRVGRRVLMARNCYIADHRHAFDDAATAVLDQGVEQVAPVEIGDGAWLGHNVVVGPGVRIGRGAVVGANSVVLADVPDRAVAVGAPARVIRMIDA